MEILPVSGRTRSRENSACGEVSSKTASLGARRQDAVPVVWYWNRTATSKNAEFDAHESATYSLYCNDVTPTINRYVQVSHAKATQEDTMIVFFQNTNEDTCTATLHFWVPTISIYIQEARLWTTVTRDHVISKRFPAAASDYFFYFFPFTYSFSPPFKFTSCVSSNLSLQQFMNVSVFK